MEILHLELPCPVCEKPVHVVADPVSKKSRWCCTSCHTVGTAPFFVPARLPVIPVAVGQA